MDRYMMEKKQQTAVKSRVQGIDRQVFIVKFFQIHHLFENVHRIQEKYTHLYITNRGLKMEGKKVKGRAGKNTKEKGDPVRNGAKQRHAELRGERTTEGTEEV